MKSVAISKIYKVYVQFSKILCGFSEIPKKTPKFDIHVTTFYTGLKQVALFLGEI
jgi:hypothetical protein